MRGFFIYILFLLNGQNLFAQNSYLDFSNFYKKELSCFIDTTRTFFKPKSFKYIVFVAKFRKEPECSDCFTLGYILNSASIEEIYANYYMMLDDQVILVKISPNEENMGLIKELKLTEMNDISKEKFRLKLFPSDDGGFTYISQGLTACFSRRQKATFYRNADEIPYEESIFPPLPKNIIIEKK
jgi:hypothetical protein